MLHFFNYNHLDNPSGNSHMILNTIDFGLATAYMIVSLWKLKTVTKLVVLLNLLTFSRLIVANFKKSVNLRDKYEKRYLRRPGLLFKSSYDFKLIIELCIIASTIVPSCVTGTLFEDASIQTFAGMVIISGFLENTLNILSELFKATMNI